MDWPPLISTLIAIGAFVMSVISLYISIRKDTFDREVATAEQTTLLLSKIAEQQVQMLKYEGVLSKLRKRYSTKGDPRLKTIELFQKAIDLMSPAIEEEFSKVRGNRSMTYREIKMQQSHYDSQNSLLAFVIQGTDELVKEQDEIPCEQAGPAYPPQGVGSADP